MAEITRREPTHSGAVTVRRDGTTMRILLVTAEGNKEHWVFPKGHIEPGESAEQAALRELHEETGVVGENLGPVATSTFTRGTEPISVQYYLVRFVEQQETSEGREQEWCTIAEAQAKLSFPDTRELLTAAAPTIRATFSQVD